MDGLGFLDALVTGRDRHVPLFRHGPVGEQGAAAGAAAGERDVQGRGGKGAFSHARLAQRGVLAAVACIVRSRAITPTSVP